MSYLNDYRTPRACYKVAPVRREKRMEMKHRQFMQVPYQKHIASRLRAAEMLDYVTVNDGLVSTDTPTNYIKEPCI